MHLLTFEFDLIMRAFLTFWSPKWSIVGVGVGLKNVLGFTDVVEEHFFRFFLKILAFDVDLDLGSLLTFWDPNGLYLGSW